MTGALTVVWVDTVGSDWLALYLDGRKVYEGHPPSLTDGLDELGESYDELTFPSAQLGDLRRMRGLPRELSGVAQ